MTYFCLQRYKYFVKMDNITKIPVKFGSRTIVIRPINCLKAHKQSRIKNWAEFQNPPRVQTLTYCAQSRLLRLHTKGPHFKSSLSVCLSLSASVAEQEHDAGRH